MGRGGYPLEIRFILNVYRMKQCVRCWVHIKEETNRLWCRKCVERVNEELEWKADRDFRYYFRWNLRHKK